MSWVATRQDLLTLGGLPADAYRRDALQITNVYQAQSTFELPGHGFQGGEPVRLTGRPGSTLPTGIQPLTWYTATVTTDPDFFQLVGVTLTDSGSGTIYAIENVWPKIDARLAARTSWVVACAKAYRAPWTTPPGWAPQLVATLVAFDLALALRIPKARYDVDGVAKAYDEAQKFIATKLDEGAPYTDGVGPIDATPTSAEEAALIARRPGPFDWPENHHLGRHGDDRA